MPYQLSVKRSAQKQINDLPASAYSRVLAAITALGDEPRPSGCRKLKARPGWRVGVGDYRIVYEVDDRSQVVEILQV